MRITPKNVLRQLLRRLRFWFSNNGRRKSRHETAIAMLDSIAATIGRPLVYLDIGSAGSTSWAWEQVILHGALEVVQIDLADEWGSGIEGSHVKLKRVKAALGAQEAKTKLFITRHPGCSSCLPPNQQFLVQYPIRSWFDVQRTEEITLHSYQSIHELEKLPQPDIVKIDVQGLESEVLQGMGPYLDKVICVEFESQFQPLYVDQKVFQEIYHWMLEKGFRLRDLKPQGAFNGEFVEFNTFWSRPENEVTKKIIDFWRLQNEVWQAPEFSEVNLHERTKYGF